MKIYTGQGSGAKFEEILKRKLGVCISSTPNVAPHKELKKVSCFIDNGAFACYQKGYPFQEDVFLNTIKKSYKLGIKLDFIVCPDILCGGKQSLDFSMSWALRKFIGTPNLALVVQDGIKPEDVYACYLEPFSYIFIGGSVDWKWQTAKEWVEFAHSNNKKCHMGQCGKLEDLKKACGLGVDSVDSTSFCRNERWDIIDDYRIWEQGYSKSLFKED